MLTEYEKKMIGQGHYDLGYTDGQEAGLEKGRAEQSVEIARRMLEMGLPNTVISQATGLSEQQIKSL